MPSPTPHTRAPATGTLANLDAVRTDLAELEDRYSQYLEQESVRSDVQCLRSWLEAHCSGDKEASAMLEEHGEALLENIKCKLQESSREIQRLDEESPIGGQYSGGKANRINQAAQTALHAEEQLAEALQHQLKPSDKTVISK